MHDHATDGGRAEFEANATARDLRLHLDNSHDERTSGLCFADLADLHGKLHAVEDERLAELEVAANLIADRLAAAPPAVVESIVGDEDADRLYLNLKGAREKLCLAQTLLPSTHAGGGTRARGNLDRAIRLIDTVGAEWCPDQWSRFDQPAPTVVDLMEALEESLAKARRTLGVKTSGTIPPDAQGGPSGSAAVDALPAPPVSEGAESGPGPASRPAPSGSARCGGAS